MTLKKLIGVQNAAIILNFGYFLMHLKEWAIPKKGSE